MVVKNSPSGKNQDELSSFHRDSPDPGILQMYLEEQKHDAIQPIHPLLKKLIHNVRDKVVLDVGCGLGSVFCQGLLYYGLKPENLYSLDPDPKNFEYDEYPRIHKIVDSVGHMDLGSNFFDVVHSNEMTLDNLGIDYTQALREINRVLKPNGFYLANEHFDQVAEMRKTNSKIDKNSENLIDIVNDEALLDELGFKSVVRIKYLDSPKIKPYQFRFYLFQKK
ncbi:MAG: class I SAM-dependent methyltransferase [Nanoarchaeota archaeon]|jgi:SAM-dependent methyltransferase|nr:class I SAM-dependent methyltransferase [Nanoarchaeota archaeon]